MGTRDVGDCIDLPRSESDRPRGGPSQIAASCIISAVLIVGAVCLYGFTAFRGGYFGLPQGVSYPYWSPLALEPVDQSYYEGAPDCEDVSNDNILCALFNGLGAGQSTNEVAVIRRATSSDQSESYCDTFYGECVPQRANISLANARRIFRYLNEVYLRPARENTIRGRIASAHTAVSRIGYLLKPLDLPLGSENCCDDANMLYIAPAFLSSADRWQDRGYALTVLFLTDLTDENDVGEDGTSPGPKLTGYADVDAYVRGLRSMNIRCYRTAAREFATLALSDRRAALRELSAFMSFLSSFRAARAQTATPTCDASEPSALDVTEMTRLKAQIRRKGFLNDLAQMDAIVATGEPTDVQ